MKLRLAAVAALVAVAALLAPATPAAAATQYTGWRHRYPTICLEQNVDASMGLSAAARAWNAAGGPRYFVAGDRWHPGGCRSYPSSQKVIVSYYWAADGACAYNQVAHSGGYIVWSVIKVNLRHLKICTGHRLEAKAAMLTHELGHDGGLDHNTNYTSIVCSGRCGHNLKPSSLDLWRMQWRWRNAP